MKGINSVTVTQILKSPFLQDLCRQRMAGKSNEKCAPTGPVPGPSGTSSAKKKGAVGFVDNVEQKNGHPSSSSESSSSGGAGHGSRSSTSSWFVIQIFLPHHFYLSLPLPLLFSPSFIPPSTLLPPSFQSNLFYPSVLWN